MHHNDVNEEIFFHIFINFNANSLHLSPFMFRAWSIFIIHKLIKLKFQELDHTIFTEVF